MDVPIEVVDKILPALRLFLDMADDGEIMVLMADLQFDLIWERADWAYHELKSARESVTVGGAASER